MSVCGDEVTCTPYFRKTLSATNADLSLIAYIAEPQGAGLNALLHLDLLGRSKHTRLKGTFT